MGLRKVLDKVKSEFGNPDITSILTDDGGEGAVNALLTQRDIGKIRTLGGNPQQNGMVERSNGKLKILISKNRAIKGGGWVVELPHATEVYNQQYNRGVGLSPADAVKLDRTGQDKVKKHVKKAYHNIAFIIHVCIACPRVVQLAGAHVGVLARFGVKRSRAR